jgi:hypothetical protein
LMGEELTEKTVSPWPGERYTAFADMVRNPVDGVCEPS